MKLKYVITLLLSVFAFTAFAGRKNATDIYIIFYATSNGKTGHIGIAVDNYKIIYRQVDKEGSKVEVEDTIATGELTYYDLWPDEDHFSVTNTSKDIPAVYYKLPVSSMDEITLNSLYDKGIPHKESYPSDGILRIQTGWRKDDWMKNFLDSTISSNREFNAQLFNCADFVRIPMEKLLDVTLNSREFLFVGWSTTPNKLYRELKKLKQVEVVKDAGQKAEGSFISERILYKLKQSEQP